MPVSFVLPILLRISLYLTEEACSLHSPKAGIMSQFDHKKRLAFGPYISYAEESKIVGLVSAIPDVNDRVSVQDTSCKEDRLPLEDAPMADMPISYNTSLPESQEVKASDLQPFLDISPDALVIVDKNGSLVQINRHTERLFGYSQAELLGQPLECLLPPRFRQPHVGHRAGFFAAPRTRAMGVGLELIGLRKDGTEFPVDISLNPLILGSTLHVIGAIRDVTAQRLLERERVQQAERIALQSTLINLSHDAILVRDPINRVISWNRGAEELYGWSEQEALGRVTHTLLKTRVPGGTTTIDAKINSEGRWEGESTHSTRRGSTVVVESRQVLIRDKQGRPTAVLEINRDITERKQQAQMETASHAETLGPVCKSEPDDDRGKRDHSQEVDRALLITRCYTPELLEAINRTFNVIAFFVQGSVKRSGARLIDAAGNGVANSSSLQILSNPATTIGFVAQDSLWPQPGTASPASLDRALLH